MAKISVDRGDYNHLVPTQIAAFLSKGASEALDDLSLAHGLIEVIAVRGTLGDYIPANPRTRKIAIGIKLVFVDPSPSSRQDRVRHELEFSVTCMVKEIKMEMRRVIKEHFMEEVSDHVRRLTWITAEFGKITDRLKGIPRPSDDDF